MSKKNKNQKQAKVVKELKSNVVDERIRLRFSPTAWAKLLYMRDVGVTEVGGFGVTPADDLLYVSDFVLPKQVCGYASVSFDDESVSNITEDLVDAGYHPKQFLRIWIHTHPSMSASPSGTDERTFARAFGQCDWAVMAIISKTGDQYCRIRLSNGSITGAFEIPMEVDYKTRDFGASDSEAWLREYNEMVKQSQPKVVTHKPNGEFISKWWHGDSGEALHWPDDEYNSLGFGCQYYDDYDSVPIPQEAEELITPNDLILLEQMQDREKKQFILELKKKYGIKE